MLRSDLGFTACRVFGLGVWGLGAYKGSGIGVEGLVRFGVVVFV